MATIWKIPDELWERHVNPLLAARYPAAKTGRPRGDFRNILDGILWRLRTGVQWKQLPDRFGSPSTVNRWFQRWAEDGIFEEIWTRLAEEANAICLVSWKQLLVDGNLGKARLGGEATEKNPCDRAKLGTKRSVLTDAEGYPLSIVIDGANVHDSRLLAKTLDEMVIYSKTEARTPLVLDRGYRGPKCRAIAEERGFSIHIRELETNPHPGKSDVATGRWKIERTFGWFCKQRAIQVRHDKKAVNHLATLQFYAALCWWRRLRSQVKIKD